MSDPTYRGPYATQRGPYPAGFNPDDPNINVFGDDLKVYVRTNPGTYDVDVAIQGSGSEGATIDWGEGGDSEDIAEATVTTHTYDDAGDYDITVTSDDVTVDASVSLEDATPDVTFAITSPADGSTVTEANYSIGGEGAEPGADVELYGPASDTDVLETVQADDQGNFIFDGGSDAPEGETTWTVKSGDDTATASVTYTPSVAADESMTHAELDSLLTGDQPANWSSMTKAQKVEYINGGSS